MKSRLTFAWQKSMPILIPDNKAFIIIDDQVTGISTVQDRIKRYQRAKAQYFTANTIEELAQKARICRWKRWSKLSMNTIKQ